MTTTTPRYCIANVTYSDGSIGSWAADCDGHTVRLFAPDSMGSGASQVTSMTIDEFRSLARFVWDQEPKPEPTCGWAGCPDEPATTFQRLARECGHGGQWTWSCDDHAKPIGDWSERTTTCPDCGVSCAVVVTESRPRGGSR